MSLGVLNLLFLSQVISDNLRLDKGTETGHMATIHSYLRKHGDAASNGTEAVHYGPSTSNKVLVYCLWFNMKLKLIHVSKVVPE